MYVMTFQNSYCIDIMTFHNNNKYTSKLKPPVFVVFVHDISANIHINKMIVSDNNQIHKHTFPFISFARSLTFLFAKQSTDGKCAMDIGR